MKYGMIQPRYGRYGICGYDVLIVGLAAIFFRTRALAKKWMKGNGYDILGE